MLLTKVVGDIKRVFICKMESGMSFEMGKVLEMGYNIMKLVNCSSSSMLLWSRGHSRRHNDGFR